MRSHRTVSNAIALKDYLVYLRSSGNSVIAYLWAILSTTNRELIRINVKIAGL
ncbi:hypothetical protein [Calothrix sp. UHCC 0171]|uniref:hypothetical protein n=1 Tax=Calothrix sp. UHCC 0171 TaxID=3110245 RepID=UPI002B20DAB3|nr:hypothetical protein [Calothrix sp. UHCC 0171]MEA5574794.1 hypothetical protein [Calothrix sp. UHCC 0171]